MIGVSLPTEKIIVMFCDVKRFYKSSMFDDIKSSQHYFYIHNNNKTQLQLCNSSYNFIASTQDNFEINVWTTIPDF